MSTVRTLGTRFRAGTTYIKQLWERREFAWYMAMGNLRSRNASTMLGLLWWVINPVLQGAVYYIVFGIILGVTRDLAFLLSGIFVFYYTSTSVTTGANAIIQNRTLLVNLHFPKLIMPVTAVTEAGVGFLASLPALYVIIGPLQYLADPNKAVWPSWALLLLPIPMVLQTCFNLGLASLTARITVPFRDITNIVPHVLRIWFYLSPILYEASRLDSRPQWAQDLFAINPMVAFLDVYRAALLGYPFKTWSLVYCAAWSITLLVFSSALFVRYEGRMARYL